jgi:hypothetical protein
MSEELAIKLPAAIREKVEDELFRTTRAAVALKEEANQRYAFLRRVAACMDDYEGEGSSRLEDPVTMEVCITAEANARQSLGDKWYLHQALGTGDEEAARKSEQIVNGKLEQSGAREAYALGIHDLMRTTHGILCADWLTSYRYDTTAYWVNVDDESDVAFDADDREPDKKYREVRDYHEGERVDNRLNLRHVRVEDLYRWPYNVTKPDDADRLIEYWPLTRTDLLMRVVSQRYDNDAVMQAIRTPPPLEETDDFRPDERQEGGYPGNNDEADILDEPTYRCYRVIGRMPLITDPETGDILTPDKYLFRDCEWVICPQLEIVFKAVEYPLGVRPYSKGVAIHKPGSWGGDSPATLIASLQDQATASMRQTVDSAELLASPQYTTRDTDVDLLDGTINVPGKSIGIPPGGFLTPLPIDPRTVSISAEINQIAVSRAKQTVSVEGGSDLLAGKVRKAAEVNAARQLEATKFSMIAENISFWLHDLWPRIMAQLVDHADDDTETEGDAGEHIEDTKAILEKRFRIVPQVSSEHLNTQSRIQRDLQAVAMLQGSPYAQYLLQSGNLVPFYMLLRKAFADMDIDPESILGTEDQVPKGNTEQSAEPQIPGVPGGGSPQGVPGAPPQAMPAQRTPLQIGGANGR